jgi:hypothetical protein
MKKLILVGVAWLVTGCAVAPLLPAEQRKAEFVDQTTATKDEAYSRALTYLAKNLGDSNHAIKLQDKGESHIVVKMNSVCPELKPASLDLNTYSIDFNLDVQTKDKKMRTSFEDLDVISSNPQQIMGIPRISDQETLAKAKTCADRVRKGLVTAVNDSGRATAAAKDW